MARRDTTPENLRKDAPSRRPVRRGMSGWERIKLTFHVLVSLALLGVVGGLTYGISRLKKASEKLPTLEKLSNQVNYGVTEIYATNRDPATGYYVRLARIRDRYQESVPFAQVPDTLKQCTVAIEDERFFNHGGVDAKGVLRALYTNIKAGGTSSQGASTLTMQLARNVVLNQDFRKLADRKFKEVFIALQIERAYSKDQILERYLNEVCYGNNIYGVKAAARIYFGKDLSRLTLAESALLAGIPQSPTGLEPFGHLEKSLKRRKDVLNKMLELGYATPAQVAAAKKEKLKILPKPDRLRQREFRYPYFTEYVYNLLKKKLGEERVMRGGLKVYTTMNTAIQQSAEQTVKENVRWLRGDGVRQGAIVAMDPHTGFVRAIAGGVDYAADNYNNAVPNSQIQYARDSKGSLIKDAKGRKKLVRGISGMQPGSSFKPIVYAAAFDMEKLSEYSTIYDGYVKRGKRDFNGYKPSCYGGVHSGHGAITVKNAVANSHNIAAVRAGFQIGINKLVEYSHRLGIDKSRFVKGDATHNYALALGSGEVSPLELATVYSTFANDGHKPEPILIRCIYDGRGTVIERNDPQITRAVISHRAASQIAECLRAVVETGTAKASGLAAIPDAHGKTGTTSDNLDAWFAGYTSQLTAIVWISGERKEPRLDPKTKKPLKNKDGSIVMRTVKRPMEGVTGGQVVAPIWGRFMREAIPIQLQSPGASEYKLPDAMEARAHFEETRDLNGSSKPAASSPAPRAQADPADPVGDSPTATGASQDRDALMRAGGSGDRVTVKICTETSKLAGEFCPDTEEKTFTRRNIPRPCRLHKSRARNDE